jgi:hypothetical protein
MASVTSEGARDADLAIEAAPEDLRSTRTYADQARAVGSSAMSHSGIHDAMRASMRSRLRW